ncbi:MAG: hypothetical protein JW829_05275 [Pirellulales bacterium]|nr:hypothetical protein [Pirellulales bacterium]
MFQRILTGVVISVLWMGLLSGLTLGQASQPAQQVDDTQPAGMFSPQGDQVDTPSYSRSFVVHYDPQLLPLGELANASLSEDLVQRALGTCKAEEPELKIHINVAKGDIGIMIGQSSAGELICTLRFNASGDVNLETRKRIWSQIVWELGKVWHKAQDDALAIREAQQRKTCDRLAQDLAKVEAELDEMMETYINLQVATVITADALRKELQETIASRRANELEIISLEARHEATEKRIDELRKQHASQTANDAISQQLRQILTIREQALERAMELHRAASVSATEVAAAQEALARAKVELIQAEEEQALSGVNQIQTLNELLADTGINLAEKRAALKATREQIDGLRDELASQLRAEMELGRIKQQMSLLQNRIQLLDKRQLELERTGESVVPFSIMPWGE